MFSSTQVFRKSAVALAFATLAGASVAAPINVGPVSVPSVGNALSLQTSTGLDQVYYFNLTTPAGSLSAAYNSDPIDNTLAGKFFTSNSSGALLSQLATFTSALNGNVTLSYGAITSGYYAFQFTSTATVPTAYSGQFSTRVPAPAALGLVSLGLIGLGLLGRRRTA
jgi:hypothetical protein